jgi:hypothetical protein
MNENGPSIPLAILQALAPIVAAAIAWVFSRPNSEETRIWRLRKELLSDLRMRISVDVAQVVPEKVSDLQHDEYVAICRSKLVEYFAVNSSIVIDLLECEKLYKGFIRYIRAFKYAVVVVPILGIVASLVLYMKDYPTLVYAGTPVLLVLLIVVLWILMERKKDKYHDLCAKYEITESTGYGKQ